MTTATSSGPGSASVRVRGLRKAYRDVTAVDGVDLDISHG
jgi:ABC-type multidrug transport system ATPase subunit